MGNIHTEQQGFSLVELLVVIIIIAIIAAIAIPNFLASRRAANESTTLGNLRTIHTAEATFATTGSGTYDTLANVAATNLLDSTWADGVVKNGYTYNLILGTGNAGFCVTATRNSAATGDNSYAISHQGALYQLAGDLPPTCDPDDGSISTGTVVGG